MRLPPLDLVLLSAHYLLSASDAARAPARPAGPPARTAGPSPVLAPALAHAARAGLLDAGEPRRLPSLPEPYPAPCAFASPAWADLPPRQRAEWALATADAGLRRIDTETALADRERDARAMTLQWLHQPAAPRSCTAPAVQHLRARWNTLCERHDAAIALYWHAQRDPLLDEDAAREHALRLIPHAKAALHSIEEECFYQTNQLADRFDLDRLLAGSRAPLDLLRAVHAFLANDFPEHRALLLDEAALAIAARLRQRCMARSTGALRETTATAAFREAIHAEIGALAIATAWLPLGGPRPDGAAAWFDGVAVRNASGADVAALVAHALAARRGFAHAAGNEAPDPVQAEHWMRQRLRDLGESARFPFGTPLQSIDTVLLRLGPSHGIAHASGEDLGAVLADFNRLCAAWRIAPRHWISPGLSAAIHLAHADTSPRARAEHAPSAVENALLDEFIRHLRIDVRLRQERADTPPGADPRATVHLLEETIEHADTARARRGAFGFDIDTLIAWLDGRIAPTTALAQTLPGLPVGERARLGMLHGSLTMLGEWQPRYLPLTGKMTLDPPARSVVSEPTRLPLRHHARAARARDGAVVPLALEHAPDARLVYLRGEQRLVPLIASEAAVWELNWQGHIVGTVDERRLGNARRALIDGTRGPPPRVAMPRGSAALREGITVKEVQRWLDSHPAPPPRAAPVALSDIADFGDDAEQRTIRAELDLAYHRSATLRLLLQRAPARADAQRVRFTVAAGARARYAVAEHRIIVPPARELENVEVLGPAGAARTLPTAVWLHELIHATTSLFDPPAPLSRAHRGPVVYLTARVLYEMNRTCEERVAYATADAFDAESLPAHLERIKPRVLLENLLLDRQLARANAISARTLVLGTEVAQRVTVRAAILLERAVRGALRRAPAQASFVQRLLDRFRWDTLAEVPDRGARLRAIDEFVFHARDMYERSAWSGGFLDAWLEEAGEAPRQTRWALHALTGAPAGHDAVPCRLLASEHRAELSLSDAFVYLSPIGYRPYTMRRRVACLLARLGMPADIPMAVTQPETERGALAYVEDRLLGLPAHSEERRVAARIGTDVAQHVAGAATNASNDAAPAAYRDPTRARRAADDEDAYLAAVCPPLTGCPAPP
ncbi:hypothetical protein OVY01_06770 [Robbsia sp. Bb-Pol-6]|uniref:Uncharacterized protein n=1 Tax=Robbsia betulipollinis TaxID=2981849 RepID=A0ABT3ZK74_9BURK|nr:hypothetical protein [Robbsia betulipollinis]MCY0386938.1 hypothetical protein [Robbsia betulipollinis]